MTTMGGWTDSGWFTQQVKRWQKYTDKFGVEMKDGKVVDGSKMTAGFLHGRSQLEKFKMMKEAAESSHCK